MAALEREGHEYRVFARDKDITLDLLDRYGIAYTVPGSIGVGRFGSFRELVEREIKLFSLGRSFKSRIIMGTSVNAARVARLIGAQSIILNEDNASYVPLFRWLAYPWATAIVTPDALSYENYGKRHLTYPSYQKLFYLHPNRFVPDKSVREDLCLAPGERYAIVRLSALRAHHDRNAVGISRNLIFRLLELFADSPRLFISCEGDLPLELEPYRLKLPPERIHHALAFADFFLGDSQSMTMEAALLGTPSFRLNSFVGKISVIGELEKYGLAFGFNPGQETMLLDEVERCLALENREAEFRSRWEKMISEKIDPLPFLVTLTTMMLDGRSMDTIRITLSEKMPSWYPKKGSA